MNTRQFLKKLGRWARKRSINFHVEDHESKGSHRTIYMGNRRTIVPWTTNDLTTGTVHGVLKQLGVDDLLEP